MALSKPRQMDTTMVLAAEMQDLMEVGHWWEQVAAASANHLGKARLTCCWPATPCLQPFYGPAGGRAGMD